VTRTTVGIRDFFRHRLPESRIEPRVEFLGEQDGPSERDLKAVLSAEFRETPAVRRAYLAQLGFQPGAPRAVALCIRASGGQPDEIARRASKHFAGMFVRDVALDIIFVSHEQEADLQRVCTPFYPPAA